MRHRLRHGGRSGLHGVTTSFSVARRATASSSRPAGPSGACSSSRPWAASAATWPTWGRWRPAPTPPTSSRSPLTSGTCRCVLGGSPGSGLRRASRDMGHSQRLMLSPALQGDRAGPPPPALRVSGVRTQQRGRGPPSCVGQLQPCPVGLPREGRHGRAPGSPAALLLQKNGSLATGFISQGGSRPPPPRSPHGPSTARPTARPTRSLPPAGSPGRCHFQCHTGVWGPRLSGESEGRRAASAGPPVAEDGAGAARSAQVLAGRLYVTELTATRRSRFRHVPERS